MAPETIREHLVKVLQTENVSADGQSLRLLARAARGSMRDALSLADQAISFGSGRIDESTVRQMLGSVDRSYVFRLIDALAGSDGKTVVETSEALRLNGLSAASTLEEMSAVLQRMAVLQAVPASADADDADPDAAELIRLAALMPADETQLLYSMCLHGRTELGLAPDEYAALTMVLLRLLAFKPRAGKQAGHQPVAEKKTLIDTTVTPTAPVTLTVPAPDPVVPAAPPGQQLHVVSGNAQTGHQPRTHEEKSPTALIEPAQQATNIVAIPVRIQADSRAETAAGQAAAVLVPTEEGAFWHDTVQQLTAAEAITAMVRELALQSQLVARDTDQWILRVERESLNQAGSRDRLATALQASGHAVRLVVEVGRVTDSPARRNAAHAAERQLAAEKIIFGDPFVQTMMRDFGAKIVPGSIKPA
jgi:DNA polymerase-3 subunit gamma/tau